MKSLAPQGINTEWDQTNDIKAAKKEQEAENRMSRRHDRERRRTERAEKRELRDKEKEERRQKRHTDNTSKVKNCLPDNETKEIRPDADSKIEEKKFDNFEFKIDGKS